MADETLTTRETLLLRLRDRDDGASWAEFAEIYTPLLYRYCLKREIAEQDASDIVQEVMRSVSLAMGNFEYDPEKGRFKAWLFTAVRHAICRHFRTLSRRPITARESKMIHVIETTPDEREAKDWERDYRQEMLCWAMKKVRPEFGEKVWSAFEETALGERNPEEVAAELGMTRNSVNVAKCRIVKRLREKVESIDAEDWESDMIEISTFS